MRVLLSSLLLLLLTSLVSVAALPARAQTQSFEEITGGKAFPNLIKARDLSGSWRRLSIVGQNEAINPYMGGFSRMLSQTGLNTYFTKGETVTLGGESFLVAYREQIDTQELMQEMRFMGEGDPDAEPRRLPRDATLVLSLVNLGKMESLNDIRPFDVALDLERELTAQEADAASTENLRRLGETLIRFARGHGQRLPQMGDAQTVRRRFFPYVVRRRSLLMHPKTKEPYRPNTRISNRRIDEVKTPAKTVLFYEGSVGADGNRGVVYLDGRTERVPEARWASVKKASDTVEFVQIPTRRTPMAARQQQQQQQQRRTGRTR